jgi:hypothetical protein
MSDDLQMQRLAQKLAPYLSAWFLRARVWDEPGLTYTPTYTGSTLAGTTTYTTQQGWYWRFGSFVAATGLVVWTAATGTGNAQISLPFVPSATVGFRASGSARITTVTFANSTPMVILSATAALFTLDSPLSNAAGTAVAMEAAGNIIFSLFYGTDG